MHQFIATLGLCLAFSATASDTLIYLKPGNWSFHELVSTEVDGVVIDDRYEACITEDEATQSAEALLAELAGDECDITSHSYTSGRGEATLKCYSEDLDAQGMANIIATHTDTDYQANTKVNFVGGYKVDITITAKHVGACS